jgi:hypothetical protein
MRSLPDSSAGFLGRSHPSERGAVVRPFFCLSSMFSLFGDDLSEPKSLTRVEYFPR